MSKGGTDEYSYLVIIDVDVHKLIHATKGETIRRYCKELKVDYYMKDKIDRYRKVLELEPLDYFFNL